MPAIALLSCFMTGTVYCRWREIVDGIHGNCYCKKVPRVSGYAVSERWRVNGVETYPAQAEKFRLSYTGYKRFHRRTFLELDLECRTLRPIAIVPATPSTLDGLCGPGQRNGVGSSWKVWKGARPPSTVFVWLWFYRREAGQIFARGASASSFFLCVRHKLRSYLTFCAPDKS